MEGRLLVRVCVVYDTKYGNTKLVAENIAEGLREVGGIQTAISHVEGVDHETLHGYDAVLIGSPNHYSGPTKDVQDFIDNLRGHDLEGKAYAVFDTFVGRDSDFFLGKASRKMEKAIGEKVPDLKLLTPGLSIRVRGTKGPIVEGELPKCRDFGRKIGNQLIARNF
jgi:flavodoxin